MDVFCVRIMDKIKLFWSKTNRWHRAFLLFLLVELRILPGGMTGFTCNDPALSHPFTGDTISWKLLLATTVLLPLIIMLIVERKYHSDKTRSKQLALFWYREHLFGVLINLVTIQSLKMIVGSPRPHFFDTCGPKEALTCQESEYVATYTCTKAHWLSQSDRSFPSGHTSLAVHTGLLLAYYLYKRSISPRSAGVVSAQLVLLLAAVYCAVSRITDHRHHWWDVLAGAVLSAPILFYTVLYSCCNFECRLVNIEKDQPNGAIINNTESIQTKAT